MIHNFNPGPAALPPEVIARAQAELADYHGTGMSILEMSHRSKEYEAINAAAEANLKALLGLGDDYRVLFMQGGASLQFALIPLNFLSADSFAEYIITGSWGEKAFEEAKRLGQARILASTAAQGYRNLPDSGSLTPDPQAAFLHITTNETIQGVQWPAELPLPSTPPLVADMSSDFLSRPFDARKFALIYAGAQKNLGPAGVTIVVIRQDLIDRGRKDLPVIMSYATFARNNSLYNTPPVFAVYMVNLVLEWIKDQGGLTAMAEHNARKAALVYAAIDGSQGFYAGHAAPEARSQMNVTFRLPSPELEKKFLTEAQAAGMVGLAGHRSVGGIRASLYNAVSIESATALAGFMQEFAQRYG
ncbi:MAG: 3-phosphoserine/phosphohydroxythreonine transaminase [Chloroflexus sp.]